MSTVTRPSRLFGRHSRPSLTYRGPGKVLTCGCPHHDRPRPPLRKIGRDQIVFPCNARESAITSVTELGITRGGNPHLTTRGNGQFNHDAIASFPCRPTISTHKGLMDEAEVEHPLHERLDLEGQEATDILARPGRPSFALVIVGLIHHVFRAPVRRELTSLVDGTSPDILGVTSSPLTRRPSPVIGEKRLLLDRYNERRRASGSGAVSVREGAAR